MSDPNNLSGLDAKSAQEYVLSVMTTLKLAVKKQEEKAAQIKLWKDRVALAESKGAVDLKTRAEEQVGYLESDLAGLTEEIQGYKNDLAKLRPQLETIKNAPTFTVDTDQLVAEYEVFMKDKVEDTPEETEEAFDNLEGSSALDALKAKMKEEGEL